MPTATPSEALDLLGMLASGPVPGSMAELKQRRRGSPTMHVAPGTNPYRVHLGPRTPERVQYDRERPFEAIRVPSPWPRIGKEAGSRWSQQAEAEARARGWMTSRPPTVCRGEHEALVVDGVHVNALAFDAWWPGAAA